MATHRAVVLAVLAVLLAVLVMALVGDLSGQEAKLIAEYPPAPSASATELVNRFSNPLAVVVSPAVRPQQRFWDRQQRAAFAVGLGVRALDAGLTCRNLARGGREMWIPSQRCEVVAPWILGGQAVTTTVQWLLWRRAGRRHTKAERWLGWVGGAGPSAAGIGYSALRGGL